MGTRFAWMAVGISVAYKCHISWRNLIDLATKVPLKDSDKSRRIEKILKLWVLVKHFYNHQSRCNLSICGSSDAAQCCLVTQLTLQLLSSFQGNRARELIAGQLLTQKRTGYVSLLPRPSLSQLFFCFKQSPWAQFRQVSILTE